MSATPTTDLQAIAEKVRSGERLSYEDGLRLYASPDLHTLGELANLVRERRHGRTTYYNINRHINYTNYCVLRCKFCSFRRSYPKGERPRSTSTQAADQNAPDTGGYELTLEQIVEQAKEAAENGATEVHIVGGLHPTWRFDYYLDMCRRLRDACPRLHVKAFTAIEIIHFARMARPRLSIRQVLEQLRDAGLGSLPGGGAEIFDDRVHDEAFSSKVGSAGWFEVHRTAHDLGLFTNATMLYGHIERVGERVAHLIKLREHQDASLAAGKAHFKCFVPLSFVPDSSAWSHLPGPTGRDDLRTLATARLMLDNIPHVKAFWVMQTPKLAQVSLNFGVDDMDGTVVYYDITKRHGGGKRRGGGGTHQELSVDRLQRLIVEAGGVPVERDTLYRPVIRENGTWRIEENVE